MHAQKEALFKALSGVVKRYCLPNLQVLRHSWGGQQVQQGQSRWKSLANWLTQWKFILARAVHKRLPQSGLWSCSACSRSGTKATLTHRCLFIRKVQHHPGIRHTESCLLLEHEHMHGEGYPGLPLRQRETKKFWLQCQSDILKGIYSSPGR